MAPALAARGLCSAETLAPGELSTMSMPLKSNLARSWTFSTDFSPNEVCLPTERAEASATTSSAGKSLSARICNISRPTLPVAPTTATLYPMAQGNRRWEGLLQTLPLAEVFSSPVFGGGGRNEAVLLFRGRAGGL